MELSVRDGKVLLVRGRIPGTLFQDLSDAVKGVKRATIAAVREPGGAQLRVSGIDDFTAQRLRNIFRIYPVSRLSAAPIDTDHTFGQLLGIAWLAWIFDRRS